MTLPVSYNPNTTQIVPTCDHTHVSCLEFYKLEDLAVFNIKADSIVYLDERVRVPDGSTIVRNQVWNSFAACTDSLDTAQFVASLNIGDAMKNKSSFNIVKNAEKFVRPLD